MVSGSMFLISRWKVMVKVVSFGVVFSSKVIGVGEFW